MPFTNKNWALTKYRNSVFQTSTPITCPNCKISMLPKDFEKHCQIHNLNSKICCVWCNGNIHWNPGQKLNFGLHLYECFEKFLNCPTKGVESSSTEEDTHFEMDSTSTPTQGSVGLFNYSTDVRINYSSKFFLPPNALGTFSLLQVEYPPLSFQDESLNLARGYLQKYLDTKNNFDWIHIIVAASRFGSFVQAMNEDNGTTRTLPFSCWCDGGQIYSKDKHHRHMIVVSPKNHFENFVWNKVENHRNLQKIDSPYHLVQTLGCLSQSNSQCQFIMDCETEIEKNMNFYIFQTLPLGFEKALVIQWDGGISTFLEDVKFKKASLEAIIEKPMIKVDTVWKQKIGDFYDLEHGIVLLVEKRFIPTPEETPYFLYLMNGRKLYFKSDPENEYLDEETWLNKQVEGGNCFYDNVTNELWTPKEQNAIKIIIEKMYRITHLERDNVLLREKWNEVKEEEVLWKKKISELDEENKILNKKILQLYEEERKRLQYENEQFRIDNLKLLKF